MTALSYMFTCSWTSWCCVIHLFYTTLYEAHGSCIHHGSRVALEVLFTTHYVLGGYLHASIVYIFIRNGMLDGTFCAVGYIIIIISHLCTIAIKWSI